MRRIFDCEWGTRRVPMGSTARAQEECVVDGAYGEDRRYDQEVDHLLLGKGHADADQGERRW
jgi:hypothetical protein